MGTAPSTSSVGEDRIAGELDKRTARAVVLLGDDSAHLQKVLNGSEIGVAEFQLVGGEVGPKGLLEVVVRMIVAMPVRKIAYRAWQEQPRR